MTIRGRHSLMAAALTTLQAWLPATLVQAAADAGADPVPTVKTWTRPTTQAMPDHRQLPMVLVTSTGTLDQPEVDGEGDVSVTYDLIVNPVVRADGFDQVADRISLYAAAIRACLEQHRTLGVDWVSDLEWVGESYGEEVVEASRTLAEALVTFHVNVSPVHNRNDVPTEDDAPTVETTNVTVDYLEEE